ncbi:DGAT1/2-independent enzyme synthesizing storage lipids-like isoform X3 [Haliotis cracherodii]|uniref:DGAT1/2-independent enzyme synthesizing storage lipids-like isoform X3 n=1 Tax=Haliotis cracherodii TaxID=6455 RepID=UPI0039ECD4C9
MYNLTVCVDYILQQVGQLDIDYLRWVVWLTYPIIISFLLPLILLVFLYASVLFLLVYRQRHRLRDAYAHDFWDGARKTLAALWDGQGRIWHGWRLLMEVFHVTPGTVQSCVDVLKAGHILTISPGGVREALFGDEYYHVMWAKRTGFAKVALQANVPVIPMFTMNSREAFRTPGWGRSLLRKFYEITRLPLVPIYGFFPVKLRTYLGKPLYPSSDDTPETFASKVQRAVEALVKRHQQVPGSVVKALLDRMPWKIKKS